MGNSSLPKTAIQRCWNYTFSERHLLCRKPLTSVLALLKHYMDQDSIRLQLTMSVEMRLSQMSDSGKFEKVSSAVLRRADPLYESAIQTGINAEGKPIKDPVDGIGRVKGSDPAHYIFFEYTTTKRSGLHSKWLADPDPSSSQSKGDLLKVADKVEQLREENPKATFTAVLVSNRSPKSETITAANHTADSYDLELDIWGIHELSDFLNTDPDGQYIRSQFFGIDEERLSEPLLRDLSKQSIEAYQQSFRIMVDESRVKRPELSMILNRARSSKPSSYLIPIIGNSGFGKTVTCHQAMDQWWENGKPALRLQPRDLEGVSSLSQALHSALERLHPSLHSSAEQEAIRLGKSNSLLLVVDDLSRADNSRTLFSRLLNWTGSVKGGDRSHSGGVDVTILCPVWPQIWTRVERDIDYNKFADPIELGPFSSEMAAELIQSHADSSGVDLKQERAYELAEKIGFDPHLIGLLGKLLQRGTEIENLPETSKDVLREYVQYTYETASDSSDGRLIEPDFKLAVEDLSYDMLARRELNPAWRTVRKWAESGSDNLEELRSLTMEAQLLILLREQTEQFLSFRHDRLRDYLLSTHSFNLISEEYFPSYLSDPYYYSILGQGIGFFRPSKNVLSDLCEYNPLSLLEALHVIAGDAPEYETKISAVFLSWLDNRGGHKEVPGSLLGEAMNILQETNSGQVSEITNSLPQFPPILLARFRNGDLVAGIQYCNGGMGGSPNSNNPQRDSVFEDAKQRWSDQYTEALSEALSSIDTEHAQGALRLAGYLGRPQLVPGLKNCWEEHKDNPELLPAFLWAAFQCGIPKHQPFVDQVISHWDSLPKGSTIDDTSNEFGTRNVFSEIKFALTRDISEAQVHYLIQAVGKFQNVDYLLVSLLRKVPDPDALELVVRKRAENMREIDGFSPWATSLMDEWRPRSPRGKSIPSEVKARMKEVWKNEENVDELRTGAFQLWARSAEVEDLEELEYASETELFTYTANYYRLQLGDKSVITSPAVDFVQHPRLLDALPNAWCAEAFELVRNLINEEPLNESNELFYQLAETLYQIPQQDAEEILDNHWDKVNTHPKFFQAALYTGTSRTRELAQTTYANSDNPERLFEHIEMNFGFNTYGKSELITKQHLYSLEPYLGHIRDMDLVQIADKANEIGMEEWGLQNLKPHLSEDWQKRRYPTDRDIQQELDQLKDEGDIRGWMLRFDRRSMSRSRAFDVVEEWLQDEPTVERYRIAAEIIKNWGSREELPILEKTSVEGDRITQIYKDAEFGVKVRNIS